MSTINYTYNVIVDRFRQFAAGHFQLRRFTHGEISQADLEKEAEWPWMHVKPRAINYSPGTRAFSFEIFISDLPRDKEDKTGYQAESITDCSLIFQDLINEIHLGNMFGDDVVLTRPVNSEPFVEQYTHTLTGVTGTIELSLDYDWSACSIPASWNYNTPTDSPSDGWGALQFIESLDQNGVFVSLLNDEESPGNSYYYGTDAAGIKGWYAIVDNIGLTCETLPDCAVIIGIVDDIIALQTDVALKANSADLGATAFSNDYNDLDNLPTIPTATSDLTNDSGFITIGDVPAQVNSDWNAVSGVSEILNKPTIPTSLPPSGTAGGDLTGTYPNPTVNGIHGIDLQNGTPTANDTWVYGGSPAKWQHQHLNASQVDNDSSVTGATVKLALEHLDSTKVPTTRTISTTAPLSGGGDLSANRTLSMPKATTLVDGYLSATDWATFNGKQAALGYTPVPETRTLTINGTTQDLSANRTFTIASNPGTVTSVAALTLGTTGTDLSSTVANSTSTPVITINVPTASAANRGALSSTDWSTFNGKQAALGFTAENTANKQNSLAVDGTGVKFPTVDAVNNLSFIDKGKRMVSFFTDFFGNDLSRDGLVSATSGGIISVQSLASAPQRTNQIGVHSLSTSTAATNWANHVSSSVTSMYLGNGAWVSETSINLSNLSTVTERFRFISGFGSASGAVAETDGVFLTYDEGGTLNGTAASANWQCVTVANSVRTLTTTTTAVTNATWHKLRIEINAAGTSAAFYVDGVLLATHTTNIPLGSASRFVLIKQGIYKTIGTTNRVMYVDYLGYENIQTTAR